jgi:hypothetical protein
MKTDPKALLWGTIIGVGIVVAGIIIGFDFPHLRMPFTDTQAVIFLVTAILYGLFIAAYRKLWKTPGFWLVLLAFLAVHVTLYSLVVARMAETVQGPQMWALYGVLGGAEAFAFALVVLRFFHRGPDTRSFTGPK